MENKKSTTCQDKAHEYTPCDSSFIGDADFKNSKDISVSGILIPNNELENFKELYRDFDYKLNKHDENHYFAYDFISFKQKQSKILAQRIAEINAIKPLYLSSDYSQKSKHQKPAAQKENETNKRRNKNKSRKQRKQ